MLKKIGLIIGILGVLATYSFAAIFTSPTLKVFSGATDVVMPVTLNSQGDTVSAFNSTMQFDSTKLVFKGYTSSIANKDVSSNEIGPGQVKFIMYGLNSDSMVDGAVFNVIFDIIGSDKEDINVQFVDNVGSTPEAQVVSITIDPLVFSIVIKGDLNSDGFVNSADVVLMVQHILGINSNYEINDVDLNEDGDLTVNDLQILINIVLG